MADLKDEARLAVLIDADNANAQHLERLLVEIAKYGTASVRRAYGDWTSTRLAARIREQGLIAYGFGEHKTPAPFVAACTTFIYVENLKDTDEPEEPVTSPALIKDPVLDKVLAEAVRASIGDDGWANLGTVGSNLARLKSDFDTRSWGFAKLTDLMAAHPVYEVDSRSSGEGRQPSAFVRRAKRE